MNHSSIPLFLSISIYLNLLHCNVTPNQNEQPFPTRGGNNFQLKSQASLLYEDDTTNTTQPKSNLCSSTNKFEPSPFPMSASIHRAPQGYRLPVQSETIVHLSEQVNNFIKFQNQMKRGIREGGEMASLVPAKDTFSTSSQFHGGSPQPLTCALESPGGCARAFRFSCNSDVVCQDAVQVFRLCKVFPDDCFMHSG